MRSVTELRSLVHLYSSDPLRILAELDGYYECPRDESGRRLGPLVGYAGRYGEQNLQYVGDVYANFAVAEEEPIIFEHYVGVLRHRLYELLAEISTFCGMPMGGIAVAYELSKACEGRFVFPEKKIVAVASDTSREKSQLVFARHKVSPGERVAICEDVTNNFSTTDMGIALVEAAGAEVVAILGLLNRSLLVDSTYNYQDREIPVIAMVRKPIAEYKQDDVEVAAEVAAGNVVWKPKDEWTRLKAAMASPINH